MDKPKVALITGGNSGIGFAVARKLAAHGFHVILAARNPQKTAQAIAQIKAEVPEASNEEKARLLWERSAAWCGL